jgi:hypothetical protein
MFHVIQYETLRNIMKHSIIGSPASYWLHNSAFLTEDKKF